MSFIKENIKPFVKWVGGKTQLIKQIEDRLPKNFNNYFEPFVGAGAIFMHLQNDKTFINDISEELITAYNTIKETPKELMSLLKQHEIEHEKNPKEYYYKIRALDRNKNWSDVSDLKKTARMIYLNKGCFNGLYRVNKSGFFNVPWNKKEYFKTFDKDNILNLSKFLNENVEIHCGDFEAIAEKAQKGDFIFFDPPYDSAYTSYTSQDFDSEDQKRLFRLFKKLSDRGCYVMLTNHNTPLINELYNVEFNIDLVKVRRAVNRQGNNRTGEEVIIYNYSIGE
tara:strand:+ start:1722 stop:2564 length:843 start_codon:yes stop_codon:yes gene_type:complete